MKKIVALVLFSMILAGCDSKPKRYLVLCDSKDNNGWSLIDTIKRNGYIVSCTYQSPERNAYYTHSCDDKECKIKK